MAYMLSKEQYLGDAAKAWHPHLMFYAPKADGANAGAAWGADREGSPVVFDSSDHVMPEPWALFFRARCPLVGRFARPNHLSGARPETTPCPRRRVVLGWNSIATPPPLCRVST